MSDGLWNTEELMGITGAPSEYIGKRFAYARRESNIRYDWLLPTLAEVGLSKFAPTQPSPTDAFRRACAEVDQGYVKDKEANKKYKVSMIRIDESQNPIIRNIQVTEVDKVNKSSTDGRLVAQLSYNRDTEAFTVRYGWNAGYDFIDCPDFVQDRIEDAQERYQKERYLVSDAAISTMVRKILESCGITVKNIPSTWTIPVTREDTLNALLALAERMNTEVEKDIFNVDTLPVVSTKETKKKLSTDAVAYAFEKLNKVLKQEQDAVAKATDVDKQKATSQTRFAAEAEAVLSIVKEYELLIGEAMSEVDQIKAITENKLREFCADANKQAAYRAAKSNRSATRKFRKEEDEEPFFNDQKEKPAATSRKFNLSDVQQASIF